MGQEMKQASLLIMSVAVSMTLAAVAPRQLPQPPSKPSPPAPSTWTAKDSHQGFTVAADAYSDADRCKDKFAKADPYKAGILAVDVFLKNDTNYPVHIDLSTVRLDVNDPNGQHFHVPALSLEEAAREIAHPNGPSLPTPRRLPPILSSRQDSKSRDVENKLQPVALQTDIVPANGTARGFLFFDVNSHFDLVPDASLYVPDVKSVASNDSMIYFDVALVPKHPR
jgi:hypothetical protein